MKMVKAIVSKTLYDKPEIQWTCSNTVTYIHVLACMSLDKPHLDKSSKLSFTSLKFEFF